MATKAFLETEKGDHIPFLFNPSQLEFSKSNLWEADHVPGRTAPTMYFAGGLPAELRFEATFDTTDTGKPVTDHTAKLLALMQIDKTLPDYDPQTNSGRPPWAKFHWGDFHSFKAIVEDMDLTFTYFANTGTPLRAKASIHLVQFEEEASWGPQNPTSGTPEPHRVHQVTRGETLDRIAALHYGDASRWRLIAVANGIEDPLRITPGTVIVIPRLEALPLGPEDDR